MSAVLGKTKLPPVDVIETGMGIIFPMVVAPGVGVGDGVGVFVFGALRLSALAGLPIVLRGNTITSTTIRITSRRFCFFIGAFLSNILW
jgi:hypothetical protein